MINLKSEHKILECALRFILAVIFIYASIHKIAAPAQFARIIYGYQLFPALTINLIAIIVPFIELYTGIFLLLGILPRSSALWITIMLFSFIIAISINLIRGHEFDCGCFGFSKGKTSNWELLFRDIIYFIGSLYVFLYRQKRMYCLYDR
ncbi:MAG: DoxX family membrane protein [Desulfobacterales bacterium]|nr:DoxX family membrane protein [Desulfobacterales bacterium]